MPLSYSTLKDAHKYAKGTILAYYEGNSSNTINVPTNKTGVGVIISNDSTVSNLTFTINDITSTLKSNEVFDESFEPFTSVAVSASDSYRVWLRGE